MIFNFEKFTKGLFRFVFLFNNVFFFFRLLAERTVFLRKETEYQEKISTLQLKVAEMLKKPIEQRVHRLRDSNNVRPRSFPETIRVELSS